MLEDNLRLLHSQVEMQSQMEKLKLQNSFLEKQLARRISVIDEVNRGCALYRVLLTRQRVPSRLRASR